MYGGSSGGGSRLIGEQTRLINSEHFLPDLQVLENLRFLHSLAFFSMCQKVHVVILSFFLCVIIVGPPMWHVGQSSPVNNIKCLVRLSRTASSFQTCEYTNPALCSDQLPLRAFATHSC